MPTLRQFSYLVALADELHFRRAAERVNVTQPTLSAQLQQLEKRLGASLVERGGSRVMLTPLGRRVAEQARLILGGVDEIRALAAASQHGLGGTIRLGVPPTLGPYLLPHVVPQLHTDYPALKLYVREGKPADLQERLAAGEFDLVMTPLPVARSDLTVAPMFRETLQVVVASDHPFASRPLVRKADLRDQSVLAIERGHHLHEQVARICEDVGAQVLRDYEGTSLDTLRVMVSMGVGIAFLPALYVRSEIGTHSDLVVLDLDVQAYRQIGLVWRETSAQAASFAAIAELIGATAQSLLNPRTSKQGRSKPSMDRT